MTANAKQLIRRAKNQDADVKSYPAGVGQGFADALERLGYNTDSLLSIAGIDRAKLKDPEARISCQAIGQLICAAMGQRPMKNLATRLATVTPLGAFPLLDYLVATSDSIGSALRQLARYVQLVGAPYLADIPENQNPIQVRYANAPNPFAIEYRVAITLLHLRGETQSLFTASCISFSHVPDDIVEIGRILGCPVQAKGPWSGFVLSEEAWHLPMRRRDPILRGLLEQNVDAFVSALPATDPVVVEVRRALVSRLGQADVQIQSVARALATSVRSLQRRLTAAGVTHQELLDSTRREIANRYLSLATLSIAEVAYLLGYSEAAAFHRAFKRWNGIGPQAFRDQQNITNLIS